MGIETRSTLDRNKTMKRIEIQHHQDVDFVTRGGRKTIRRDKITVRVVGSDRCTFFDSNKTGRSTAAWFARNLRNS